MVRTCVIWIVSGLLAVFSLAYVAATFVYLTPPNPVKARVFPYLAGVLHPVFSQNWHLFAPNPVRTNFVLAVRCRVGADTTPWRDVTKPMLAWHHRHRTSPMSRLLRVQQNAIRAALGWSSDEWRPLICRRDRKAPICRGDTPEMTRFREAGMYLLRRVASRACDEALGPRRSQAVQVRILIHQPPVWSMRDRPDEDGSTRSVSLPWMPHMVW